MNRASMLVLALAALLAGFLTQQWLKPPPVSPPLAEPVLVDLQGGRHALAEWRGVWHHTRDFVNRFTDAGQP